MDEIRRVFGSPIGRVRSDSIASSATQSSGSRLLLRQRLAQLMTCVDDLNPSPQLQEQVVRSLDNAFLVCGKRANRTKKDNFRLHMVTWNVGTADPPDDISSLLHLNSPKTPDLYVIGLQEVYAAPHRFIIDMAVEDSWSHLFMSSLAPRGYLKVSSIRMQGLLLLFFSKLAHVPFIRDIHDTYTRTGIFGYWGNKGGVSIRLSFYGHMLCFLNCHLAAHMQYASQRVDEFEYILDTQTFGPKKAPHVLDHKLVFWFGDLNFRIQDHGMHFLRNCITSHKLNLLWSKDQLTMMKKKEAVLQEFDEGPLDFQPTYKFDRFSDRYDSRSRRTWFGVHGKMRKPAWTDRILWRVKPKESPPEEEKDEDRDSGLDEKNSKQQEEEEEFPLKLKQDSYTSNMEYGVSDHKPVIGVFTLELRKMYETPLVRVCAEGEWSADFDAMVIYSPLQPFPSSAWDWIGLYKVGFRSVSDYITYTWVKDDEVSFNDELTQVYVSKDEIPVLGGECVLCYYCSTLQCIVGISSPFKVQESKVAVEEGLAPENINGLDKATAS
ncbi:inositol polyphosphate 5-phosphatase K isoform X1 [Oncorhynchus tshawytscha]|uniref:inositol polyphosphate 5-phosphatase K isoform X1 n=1 Tax=Oncorhynchus tshawytscha TaxID=74940 RepID=UPI000D09C99F|nr:inositol polyphosphate 5-phosphatase K isoform X1 [Oncorhynchus tshawytscha]